MKRHVPALGAVATLLVFGHPAPAQVRACDQVGRPVHDGQPTVDVAATNGSGPAARTPGAALSFPGLARGYATWLVRAMDQCNLATLSVVSPTNLPAGACPQTNTATDDALGEIFAILRVTELGKIALLGTGFTFADTLRVRLMIRVTRSGIDTSAGGNQSVTFADRSIECPRAPEVFAARPNGLVAGSTDLGACLAPDTDLNRGNIQILGASLIDTANGRLMAVPGVLR